MIPTAARTSTPVADSKASTNAEPRAPAAVWQLQSSSFPLLPSACPIARRSAADRARLSSEGAQRERPTPEASLAHPSRGDNMNCVESVPPPYQARDLAQSGFVIR